MQILVAAISDPTSNGFPEFQSRRTNASNVMLSLQHDVGRWCTEYSWSADDGMVGLKVLHNFGRSMEDGANLSPSPPSSGNESGVKRVDEEDPVEGGLKGRVTAGAEFYFSAKEKSAGGWSLFYSIIKIWTYLTKSLSSFNRHSFHHPPRRDTTFIPQPASHVVPAVYQNITDTATDHCDSIIQSYDGPYLQCIHCSSFSKPFVVDSF